MGEKLDRLIEGYKPIAIGKLRYPRLSLSEDFINAFHREIDRLQEEGQNPKNLLERVNKALHFHINEERRYHKLDEEGGPFNQGSEGNYIEVDTGHGIELMTPEEAEKFHKDKKKSQEKPHPGGAESDLRRSG